MIVFDSFNFSEKTSSGPFNFWRSATSDGIKLYDLIISSGDCLSFSVKKISKPIAFGFEVFNWSSIFANTFLFQGNWPNLPKLFSSISIITTLLSFFSANTFWYKSKLKYETDLIKGGFTIFKVISNKRIKKKN